MFDILLTQTAIKDLRKIDIQEQKRIVNKLKEFRNNPIQYASKLKNKKIGSYRFRIGDFRVIFDLDKDNIVILRIGHRKDIYK